MNAFNQLQESAFKQSAGQIFEFLNKNSQLAVKSIAPIILAGFFAVSANTASADDLSQNQSSYVTDANPSQQQLQQNMGNYPVQINSISVQSNDTPGKEAVRRIGGGVVGAGVGYGVGKLVKANNFWSLALDIAGAAAGQSAANSIFKPKPTVNVNATVGNNVTNFNPNTYEFKNGTQPLSPIESAGLKTWVDAAVVARNNLAENRAVLDSARYRRTFASESERSNIDNIISSANWKDDNLVYKFNEARGKLTENMWVAAMDFNRDVSAYTMQSAVLISTPTAPGVSHEEMLKNVLNNTPDSRPKLKR